MSEATNIRADVIGVVLEFGTTGTLTTYVNDYDVATGTNESVGTSTVIPTTDPYLFKRGLRSGGTDSQPTGVSYVTIPSENLTQVPEPGATLVIGSRTWTVSIVEPFALQGVVLAYELTLAEGGQ